MGRRPSHHPSSWKPGHTVRDDSLEPPPSLIRRAGAGDRKAFDEIVRTIYPRLQRWALVKAGGGDDADEIVQRTLVRVHRGLDGFRGDARFTTWVYRIANNVWLDMERSRASRSKMEESIMTQRATDVGPTEPGPDERLARREAAELLASFFGELAPRQREVLELVDLQGYEPTEAASIMDVSPSTARVHLHRARSALRRMILERHPRVAEEYGT